MSAIDTRDGLSLDEQIAAAFAKPVGETSNQLVPLPSANVAISDAIITAQKVAVERDEAKILRRIKVMAQAAGEDWYYRYPARNQDGSTSFIEGPSIKCANNVARMYGNCQVDTRVVDNGDSWIIYARFCDYETGFSYTRPFQQRKNQRAVNAKDGGRLLDIALQIGVSKAIRNVICNALETFTNFAEQEAKAAIVGRIGDKIEHYRERVVHRLGELRVEVARVEASVGRASADWLAPDIARIIAQIQAIGDGMATADETWPGAQGAAAPRPTREQFEQKNESSPATEAATQAEPFEVTDVWGASQEYPTVDAAVDAYRLALDEGEAQKGEEGLRTVHDNNGPFFVQLQERGLADFEKELSLAYGKRAEAARANDLISDSPADAQDRKGNARLSGDPSAGEPWQKQFAALSPAAPKDDKAWAVYVEAAIAAIRQASAVDLDKLRLTDNAHMRELRKADGDLYREITVALSTRVAELRSDG